ncbi:ABC transporter ATP-binding protein [Candidatus Gottesmanbacteria bacterium]|nr:ABC transporter ATP-binding protein [Candidatus Gottesmanbacteria bacterium]
MKPIIEVKNLSKKYQIGLAQPYYSFREALAGIIKNPFKTLRRKKYGKEGLAEDEIWALKNVSLNVLPGEVIGIIGKNGAGKTTLLKLLSRITPPTTGEIILRGKVASLLEVGTGFHPELTGRENIFLNGAILGMKRGEITKKFDEIVKFAEVERFLDTPVKHFSSGMYMRLAFAVAAHLDCEILMIDEVLAVGDAQFQQKCLGKMEDISKTGRTVLFVSHNMSAVKKLCTKGILLRDGKASDLMRIDDLVENYLAERTRGFENVSIKLEKLGIEFTNFQINNYTLSKKPEILPNKLTTVSFDYFSKLRSYDLCISIAFRKKADYTLLLYTHNHLENVRYKTKRGGHVTVRLNLPQVAPGDYTLELQVWLDSKLVVDAYEVGDFKILPTPFFAANQTFSTFPAQLLLRSDWEFKSK